MTIRRLAVYIRPALSRPTGLDWPGVCCQGISESGRMAGGRGVPRCEGSPRGNDELPESHLRAHAGANVLLLIQEVNGTVNIGILGGIWL
jgi:hypothetical protein